MDRHRWESPERRTDLLRVLLYILIAAGVYILLLLFWRVREALLLAFASLVLAIILLAAAEKVKRWTGLSHTWSLTAVAAVDFDNLKRVIAFSARIGAKYLVCPVEDQEHGRRAETLGRLCQIAHLFGLSALVEFNPYSACPNLRSALDLLGSASQPNVALCVDALHLSRSGGHPDQLR